ncbi:MAG TPA: UvrD-helicase domain-containing protein [Solirubrobacterales bacterium]|nr:UvrD-helicase domain-containing protein [Solirubrobacterales bacterium]
MGDFPPNPDQAKVISSTEEEILVLAGAGTGKTTTMVARYGELVKNRGLEPRQILAITYTDKAAGELRDRIREMLGKQTENRNAPEQDVDLKESPAAVSMSNVWVGTFHAVCMRILKAWPVEAEIDPGFTIIDEVNSATLRAAAFSEALETLRKDPDKAPKVEEIVGVLKENSLREAIFFTYDELRSRGSRQPRLPKDFKRVKEYPSSQVSRLLYLGKEVHPTKDKWQSRQAETLETLVRLEAEGRLPGFDDIGSLEFTFAQADGAAAELVDLLPKVQRDLASFEFADSYRELFSDLLEAFDESYSRKKASRSTLDYEDLQLFTVELLENREEIRRSYLSRFREVMVDEFQDTNPLQSKLVNLLVNRPDDPCSVPDQPRTTLVTVGDEMQSIYRFRHADVQLIRDRSADSQVTNYALARNFRSSPTVIEAVNEIGGKLRTQVRPDEEFPDLIAAQKADGKQAVSLLLTSDKGWKPLDLGEMARPVPDDLGSKEMHQAEAEALRLARHLRDMVVGQGIPQSEIAILFRKKSKMGLFAKALRQFGLTPYIARSSGFWTSREALDMRALLAVIANPLDDESLMTVLASPSCGLRADSLILLADGRPGNWVPLWYAVEWALGGEPVREGRLESIRHLQEDKDLEPELTKLSGFAGKLQQLRNLAATLPLDNLVFRSAEMTGYDLACIAEDPTGGSWAGVRRFATLAREYEEAEGRDLRGFLDWAALSAKLDKESETATSEEKSDVIRLMTIHAAKGLEFGVVCVPDCGSKIPDKHSLIVRIGHGDANPTAFSLTSPSGTKIQLDGWEGLKEASSLSTEEEELRLFHVALTRAKRELIVSGVMPANLNSQARGRSILTRICQGLEFDGEALEPKKIQKLEEPVEIDLPGGGQIRVIPNNPSQELAKLLSESFDAAVSEDLATASTPPLVSGEFNTFPNVPLSFTAMNEFADCPTAFYTKRILGLPEPERSVQPSEDPADASTIVRDDATKFGSGVHDLLESMARKRWKVPDQAAIQRALDSRGAGSNENVERATGMIHSFVQSDFGIRLAGSSLDLEVPLLVRIGQVTIRGFADVIAEGTPPMVLDYKTNRLDARTPSGKMADYVDQRDLYALALADSRGLDTVETAFVFLEDSSNPVLGTMKREDLEKAREKLRDSLAEITAGHYFGGPDAARQPCGKCWACKRLEARLLPA